MPNISIKRALVFSFGALPRRAGEILPRVLLPWFAGGLLLYGVLHIYFQRLQIFLAQPSDRTGSLILGVVASGLFLLLFLHCMICAAVAGVLLDQPERPMALLRARRREWRLYAAHLRLLLVLSLFVPCAIGLAYVSAGPLRLLLELIALVTFSWTLARLWFLMVPVSVKNFQGPVLRRAWRQSAGHAPGILAVFVLLSVPGLALEFLAETAMRGAGVFPAVAPGRSFGQAVEMCMQYLPVMVCVVSIMYLVSILLLVAGQVCVFRQLAEGAQA